MQIRPFAILALLCAVDLSGKEGYFVKASGVAATPIALVTSAADATVGLVLDGTTAGDANSIAVPSGTPGSHHVKLAASPGTPAVLGYGALTSDGSVKADPGTGARVLVCRFLQTGTAGELVEAVLIEPIIFAA